MRRVDVKTGFLCNNNCRFCVQAHNKLKGNRSIEEIKKDLEGSRKDCDGVVLTGGEVSIRKDFFEIVSYAKELGFSTIQVQTNGRMFCSMEFTRKAVEKGVTEVSPALHGHCAPQHDYLTRSEGSFKETVRGIINLKKLGIPVIMNTVVVKPNYRELPELANLLVKLDVDQFQFAFVHALGNAMKNLESMVPNVSLAAPYIHKALQIGIDSGKIVMAEAMPYCVMKGYESYVAEKVIPYTVIRGVKEQNTDDYSEQRVTKGKRKAEKCRFCIHDRYCEGPWKEYPDRYGFDEFVPIVPKYMNFRRYIELRSVIDGIKKAHRDYVEEEYKGEFESYIKRLGLQIVFSKQACDGAGRIMYYASKDLSLAKTLKDIEKNISAQSIEEDIEKIGGVLGYPKCCIDFFKNHHSLPTPEIIFNSYKNTQTMNHAELNVIDGSRRVVSHIPCSFDCNESIKGASVVITNLSLHREDMTGSYIFFRNGYYFSLKRISKSFYKIVGSGSNSGGKVEDIPTLTKLSANIDSSDYLRVGEELTFFKRKRYVAKVEGKDKDWMFVEYG